MGPSKEIGLTLLSSFATHPGGSSSAEIVAFDPQSKRLFVVNSIGNMLDILDFSNPEKIKLIRSVELSAYGKGINSVSVRNGIVAAAIEHQKVDQEGFVAFFNIEGVFISKVKVGVLPDMLTFSPDGKKILVANEGQPSDDYTIDPEGSISIIEVPENIGKINQSHVITVDFRAYNDSLQQLKAKGVRIFGPGATVAQDLEPEYVAVTPDSETAYVSLQENNAIAIVDIAEKKILGIKPLGTKEIRTGEGKVSFGKINASCTLAGLHQPDGISAYSVDGQVYLITANEGDPRKYEGYKEVIKLGNEQYILDPEKFPNASELKEKNNLGKLNVSRSSGDLDEDGDFEEVHCYGSRSFSIWDKDLKNIYDSGDDFENIACKDIGYCKFNERFQKIREDQADHRGPEPESVVVGKIGDRIYAFITLERYGGVMAYNVTDPHKAYFADYVNSNTPDQKKESRPEGLIFIPGEQSPNKRPLIVVANEGTSTLDVYEVVSR